MNIQKRGVERTSSLVVVLVVVAIAFSLVSISVNMKNQGVSITGRTSYYGNVTTEIDHIVECILTESPVDFGVIGLGVENDTSNDGPKAFRIENNGSVQVDVALNSTKVPGTFFQGTNPIYQYKSSCVESSCAGDLITEWTNFTAVQATIASALWMNASSDLMRFDIKIKAPLDEPAGAKSDTLTFTCSESGFGGGEPESCLEADVGDSCGGGIVAFNNGTYVLISAGSDQSTGIVWDDSGCDLLSDPCIYIGTTTEIGTGKSNTETIIAAIDSVGGSSYAAKLCDDLFLNDYTDWFLPSKDELNESYNERVAIGGLSGAYWSSSEVDGDHAWTQDFDSGYQDMFLLKETSMKVRCVRAESA